ncbi:restriction endonuclease subunit S [Shewanella rhizosphaerae]|uniref:restriction endonuclease subunit S n=1 Tax=Shewanella rhizosphaerae TaxID=2864207 RepID=UPI001C6566FF|nr:restriction endonuclease subunit S [Shewanella rhizosphaerae]QYK14667.1 restriction endonuclease subunit S [Shewanella rhizosphaerae]
MSDFEWVQLGKIAAITLGQSPDSETYTDDDRYIPFLQGCGDFTRSYPETDVFCTSPGKVAKEGSLLVSVRAPVGTTNVADKDYCIGRGLAAVKSNIVSALYLREAFTVSASFLHRRAQGSTFDAICAKDLSEMKIPMPKSRRVGAKVTDIIQCLNSELDATQALIEKYTAIKQGMMADLFSRGIDPETKALRPTFGEAPELYYKTPLGMLPKGWDIAPFEQLSEVIDPNPSHRYPDSVSIGGVPIASTENFEGTDGFNLVKSKLVPDSEFEKQFERCKYQKDDVIFARKGRIGFARQYGEAKKVFSHTVVVMKAKAGVFPDFLLWLARSTQYLEAIDFEMNSNSGVPTLGVDVIKRVRVAVPSVEEQQDIAKCLNQINKKIHTELAFLAKTKAQKSGLMQDLLTGKVSVPA